ncbi:TetR/AcrR family transcriptional regulator [Hugenholtzia roseola]|uniref:TetR/AcrR family transcriptional regulator n=1 Tax=Hugenholtzia roseola TaxID=1002 RepID=UPI00042871E5|nr:TetR family transcriptional regulator C-terminal domain-containing protein [Hugenholtzia roseola]
MENQPPINDSEPHFEAQNQAAQIKATFIKYVRERGVVPASIYNLMAEMGEKESLFYEYYSQFLNIEQEIWADWFEETITRLQNDEVYHEYSVREKLLAFYFTLMEVLKENRSYLVTIFDKRNGGFRNKTLHEFKEKFRNYIANLIDEGIDTQEVQPRMFLSGQYSNLIWAETEFLLRFWLRDSSKGFEKTDAAIEKTVNFVMDLVGRNLADSAFDFAKFLFQSVRK